MLSWLPEFFKSVYGLDYQSMALFSTLPYVFLAVVQNGGGYCADRLQRAAKSGGLGLSTTFVRRLMNTLGLMLPRALLLLAVLPDGQV